MQAPHENTMSVKVYLVEVGDNGRTGKKIGCEDTLVPVTRTIRKTAAPLTAALTELLATPQHPAENPKLENFWKGRNLKVRSVAIRNNTATIQPNRRSICGGNLRHPANRSAK